MLRHVIEDDVLNHVAVSKVRHSTEADDNEAYGNVGPDGGCKHGPWLAVLRVNVEDASISLEDCENLAEEEREVGNVEPFKIVRCSLLLCCSDTDSTEFVHESHLLVDAVQVVVDSIEFKGEDGQDCCEAATNEDT